MMELAGAAFMVIVNNTEADDALVGASSPAAETVEIHQTTQAEDGTMAMAPVEEVPIPAGGVAELKPGGYHVMLIDLVAPLVEGEQIELTLEFANGRAADRDGARPGHGPHGHGHGDDMDADDDAMGDDDGGRHGSRGDRRARGRRLGSRAIRLAPRAPATQDRGPVYAGACHPCTEDRHDPTLRTPEPPRRPHLGHAPCCWPACWRSPARPRPRAQDAPEPELTWAPLVTLPPIVAPSVVSPAELADGYTLGDPEAPVAIEVWEDFQCPFCQRFASRSSRSSSRSTWRRARPA